MFSQLSQKKVLYLQEAFCISVAICIGVAIAVGFKISHGYWIPMTTGIMFMPIDKGQGAFIKKTFDRVLGTITGAMLGFLFVDIFMYGNYHWIYLLPVIWYLGMYASLLTGNYALAVVMITMFVPLLDNLLSVDPNSTFDVFLTRIYLTIIGVIIALIAEYVIYRNASSTRPAMKQGTNDFFQTQGKTICLASDCFLDVNYVAGLDDESFRKTVWNSVCSNASIENLFLSIRYEFDYHKDQEIFYRYFFNHTKETNRMVRKLLAVIGHDKYDDTISCFDELTLLSNNVSQKYRNMLQYFDGRTDSTSEEIQNVLTNIESKDKFNSTYLYIKALYELSILADKLSDAVYKKKFY